VFQSSLETEVKIDSGSDQRRRRDHQPASLTERPPWIRACTRLTRLRLSRTPVGVRFDTVERARDG